MLKRLLILSTCLIITGCGSLRPDYSMSAIDANYPTAEMYCNGKVYHGLGICSFKGNGPIEIAVQGYYKGSVKINSERCGLDVAQSYTDSEKHEIMLNPKSSCVIDFVVSPTYPKKSEVKVRSFKGRLYLKKLPDEKDFQSLTSRASQGTNPFIIIESSTPSRIVFSSNETGCKFKFDKVINPINNKIKIKLGDIVGDTSKKMRCLFDGAIKKDGEWSRIAWMTWLHDKAFTILPSPKIEIKKDEIKIVADKAVGVISIGDKYKIKNKGSFKVSGNQEIVRLLTTAARSVIGVWNGECVEWIK